MRNTRALAFAGKTLSSSRPSLLEASEDQLERHWPTTSWWTFMTWRWERNNYPRLSIVPSQPPWQRFTPLQEAARCTSRASIPDPSALSWRTFCPFHQPFLHFDLFSRRCSACQVKPRLFLQRISPRPRPGNLKGRRKSPSPHSPLLSANQKSSSDACS